MLVRSRYARPFALLVVAAVREIACVELSRERLKGTAMNNDAGSRELMTWIEDLVVIFAVGYAIRWLLGL
jgi:hypothetical protein